MATGVNRDRDLREEVGSPVVGLLDVVSPAVVQTPIVTDEPIGRLVENDQSFVLATGDTTPRRLADYLQDAQGAQGAQAWQEGFNVKDYGAVGDGTTDDTAALQACAAAAAAVYGVIYLPRGYYLVTDTPFSFAGPRVPSIVGESMFVSRILVDSAFSSSKDVIHIACDGSATLSGVLFSEFTIIPVSGHPGRHGINIDQTGLTTTIVNALFSRLYIDQIGGTNGKAFRTVADSTSGGGLSYAEICNCWLEATEFVNIGDGVTLRNNTITCFRDINGTGVLFSMVPPANATASFGIVSNVIASMAGQVYCNGAATSPYIAFNEFETPSSLTSTSTNDAMVDLDGGSGTIQTAVIIANSFAGLSGTGNDCCIRLKNTQNAQVAHNRLNCTAAKSIVLVSPANWTDIGFNGYSDTGGATAYSVTDGGVNTQAVRALHSTSVGAANYQILPSDSTVATNAALGAARTWTLPLANAVPKGWFVEIEDTANGITGVNTLTIARSGADTFHDGTTSKVLNAGKSCARCKSNGVSLWSYTTYTLV